MKEINEKIEIMCWQNGIGWSYRTVYSDDTLFMTGKEIKDLKENFSWDWWEKLDCREGEDLRIKITYSYNGEIIASYETWQSEL